MFFVNYLGNSFVELCLLAAPSTECDRGPMKDRLLLWLKWQTGKHSERRISLELILFPRLPRQITRDTCTPVHVLCIPSLYKSFTSV